MTIGQAAHPMGDPYRSPGYCSLSGGSAAPYRLPAPTMTRALALSTASTACAVATIALAVLTPATEHNRTAGAIGILFGGLIAPAALLAGAARD